MARSRVSVTIDKKFLDWVDKMIEEKIFANRSHAFEYALKRLMGEKALKAYFLLIFVKVLVSVSELTRYEDRNLYGKSYQVLKNARRYRYPKSLGHNFEGFFKYVVYIFSRLQRDMERKRKEIVKTLMKDRRLDLERAERTFQ